MAITLAVPLVLRLLCLIQEALHWTTAHVQLGMLAMLMMFAYATLTIMGMERLPAPLVPLIAHLLRVVQLAHVMLIHMATA